MSVTAITRNIIAKRGQDLAVQWWSVDHRGEPIPYERPAKLTVKDSVGQLVMETTDDSAQAGAEALLLTSPYNGLIQLTIPRALLAPITPGIYRYDLWATVIDPVTISLFPGGQLVPVSEGTFTVTKRITVMTDEEII